MSCNRFYHWCRQGEGLLPAGLPGLRWLARHAAGCEECRTHRSRRARLDGLLRGGLRLEAAAYVPGPPLQYSVDAGAETGVRLRRVAGALALAAVLVAAVAGPLVHRRAVRLARPVIGPSSTVRKEAAASPVLPAALGPDRRASTAPGPKAPGATRRRPALERAARHLPPAIQEVMPDERYLDGRDTSLTWRWVRDGGGDAAALELLRRRLPRPKDDFVALPLPRLASADPKDPAVRDALKAYEREAKVVDPRLFRRVTLQLKGVSLEELAAELQSQTGVRFAASRGVADEKVTVFTADRPAREVLRAVARLFGYLWSRSGEEGAYRYALVQDLRSQIDEEELRSRDLSAALLALDQQMQVYAPYAGQTPEQLRARLGGAAGSERTRLEALVEQGGWGGLRAFEQLSPAERLALRGGGELEFTLDAADPSRRLPAEWVRPLLQSWKIGANPGATNGREFWSGPTPLTEAAEAVPTLRLRVNRSELGQLSMESSLSVRVRASEREWKTNATSATLGLGRSPSVARPDNAAANRSLRGAAPFDRTVSLHPKALYPTLAGAWVDLAVTDAPQPKPTGVLSGDVWEEVHRKTGRSIVADAYTRLYPASGLAMDRVSLFDALCRIGDRLGARWKKDGDFLLCRSTSYFWDKQKEVPNRFLRRWQQDSRRPGGLPLDDILEMTTLTDVQLDSRAGGEGIVCCWGLREWSLVGIAGAGPLRSFARFLAGLPAEHRRQLLEPAGLAVGDLPAAQQQLLAADPVFRSEFVTRLGPEALRDTRLHALYCPAGWYWWAPRDPDGSMQVRDVMLVGEDRSELLARARRVDPNAGPEQVRRSEGDLLVHGTLGTTAKFGRSRTHSFLNLLTGSPLQR